MENLAPAGSMEALKRGVAAGADAVYLGYAAFSARAGAGNFDEEELREAVRYCHLHHVRVHVTVNTLVKDGEMSAVEDVLKLLNDLRVDGVLVQDMGVADLLRTRFPDLPAHASTQMALHNASGVRFVRERGFTRAVLARECDLAAIRRAADEGIEIEVFGHGAQCVAVSGECLFSSMLGERSGNLRPVRPALSDCRIPIAARPPRGSARGTCVCGTHLPALAQAGAVSVKLEGRLKPPEYVAVVASSHRQAIDKVNAGRFMKADAQEMQSLRQIFNRGDFMRGAPPLGTEDAAVLYPQRVNHLGITLGKIARVERGFARFTPLLELHDGDGLQLRGAQDQDMSHRTGKNVPAGQEATLRLRPGMQVKPGDLVCRLTDAKQMAEAASLPEPTIDVRMHLTAWPNQPLTLTVTDGTTTVTVTGETAQPARSRALTAEDAARCLEKTGDTCFRVTETRDGYRRSLCGGVRTRTPCGGRGLRPSRRRESPPLPARKDACCRIGHG